MTVANRTDVMARDGALTGVGAVVAAVAGFLFTIMASRILGPAGAGGVFVLVAWFTIVTTALRLGTDTTLVRIAARLRATDRLDALTRVVRTLLVPVAGLSVVVAGALTLWSSRIGPMILAPEEVGMTGGQLAATVILLALAMPLQSLTVPILGLLRGLGDIRPLVAVDQVFKPAGRVLTIVGVAFVAPSVLGVAAAWSLPVMAGFVFAFIMLRQRFKRLRRMSGKPGPQADMPDGLSVRQLWGYATPRALAQLTEIVTLSVGVVLVGQLAGAHEAGLYGAVNRLALAGMLAFQAVRLVIAPEVAGLLAKERVDDVEQVHQMASGWVTAVSWPFYLLLMGLAPIVLSSFGPGFQAAVPALQVVCLGMLVPTLVGPAQSLALMAGWSSAGLAVSVVCLSANIGLTVSLASHLGATGAAVGWATALGLEALLYAVVIQRRLSVTVVGVPAIRSAIVAVAVVGGPMAVLSLSGAGSTLRAGSAVLLSLIYVVVVVVLRRWLAVDRLLLPITTRLRSGRRPSASRAVTPNEKVRHRDRQGKSRALRDTADRGPEPTQEREKSGPPAG